MSNEIQENDELTPQEELDASAEQSTETEEQSAEEKRYRRRIVWKQRLFKWVDEVSNSAGYAVWVMAAFVAILFLVPWALNLQSTVVLTESMSGTIEKGDVILTKPFSSEHDKLEVGDIALFKNAGSSFTHRVQSVNEDGTYTMRGDANDSADLFKPSNYDIEGVVVNTIHQPQAGILSLFSLNYEWFGAFWAALSSGQWATVGSLLPVAPWGFLILLFAAVLFWVVIPRLLRRIVAKANIRAALELERIRRSVEAHEETITEHDEELAELEPVVDELKPALDEMRPVVQELKQEHEQQKAEKQAEFQKQVEANENYWDLVASYDPEADYDEAEELFGSKQESASSEDDESESLFGALPEATAVFGADDDEGVTRPVVDSLWDLEDDEDEAVAVARATSAMPANPFESIVTKSTRQNAPASSLRADKRSDAQSHAPAKRESRTRASAWDLDALND